MTRPLGTFDTKGESRRLGGPIFYLVRIVVLVV